MISDFQTLGPSQACCVNNSPPLHLCPSLILTIRPPPHTPNHIISILRKRLPDTPPLPRPFIHLERRKRPIQKVITGMIVQDIRFRSHARRSDDWRDIFGRLVERGARYEVDVCEGGALDGALVAIVKDIRAHDARECDKLRGTVPCDC
jgi:hypothetical protein